MDNRPWPETDPETDPGMDNRPWPETDPETDPRMDNRPWPETDRSVPGRDYAKKTPLFTPLFTRNGSQNFRVNPTGNRGVTELRSFQCKGW